MDTNKTNSVIFRPNGNLIMKTNQRDLKKKKKQYLGCKVKHHLHKKNASKTQFFGFAMTSTFQLYQYL